MKSIRIPRTFYIDHKERGLPTPQIDYQTASHIYIFDGDYMQDLIEDAAFYSDPSSNDAQPSLNRSAKALLAAIEQGRGK